MSYKIVVEEDKFNYYRSLKNENGQNIIIQIPQYYVEKAITKDDIKRTFTITTRSEAEEKIYEIYKFLRTIFRGSPIYRSSNFTFSYLLNERNNYCKYFDEKACKITEEDLWNKRGYILYELHVAGLFVKEGTIYIHVLPTKCVFCHCDPNSIIKLKLPEGKKVPQHIITLFEKLPKEDKICSICLEELKSDISMTPCFHFFHCNCLQQTVNQGICPYCRQTY